MSNEEQQVQSSQMTLGKGIGIYAVLMAVLVMLANLAMSQAWLPGGAVVFYYLASGFLLNRVVLRGLIEWHPVYNTIQNVSVGKLQAMLFWPIAYPNLFFRLGVIKIL
jgi:hypothetical protein